MPTLFSEIYTKANILFDDAPLLGSLTDDEYDELLELFLSKAKIYFKSCKKDLSDIDDVLKEFNEDLDDEEQWVLALGIRLVWFERKLYKEENLRDRMTTKDYNASHSPANLIDKLILLRDKTERDLKQRVVDYSFNEFEGFN
jgi:hypothetical protein